MRNPRIILLLIGVFTLQVQTAESVERVSLSNELWTGAVAWIGTPDGVILKRSWGWMDKAKKFPIHENAIFDLASVTKVVGTTTAVALCMDRNLIDSDTVFTNYLSTFKGALKGPLTVRDLARHISGFNNSKPYDIEGKVKQRILKFSPVRPAGTAYDYSCANFILLGLVVEKVTGENIADFCRENVFDPLQKQYVIILTNRIGDHTAADKARIKLAHDLLCETNQEQREH